ncbi:hypothetical protein BKA62DRAFT_51345, partial [Auriculariales sp. MPI-PUGE-AT-0066]
EPDLGPTGLQVHSHPSPPPTPNSTQNPQFHRFVQLIQTPQQLDFLRRRRTKRATSRTGHTSQSTSTAQPRAHGAGHAHRHAPCVSVSAARSCTLSSYHHHRYTNQHADMSSAALEHLASRQPANDLHIDPSAANAKVNPAIPSGPISPRSARSPKGASITFSDGTTVHVPPSAEHLMAGANGLSVEHSQGSVRSPTSPRSATAAKYKGMPTEEKKD